MVSGGYGIFQIKATKEEIELAGEFMKKPPVSFTYDGMPFPAGWTEKDGVFTSQDKTLQCAIPFTTYADSAAVEWLPRFTSIADQDTGRVQNLIALDAVFPADGEPVLYSCLGARSQIDDFSLQTHVLTEEPLIFDSCGSLNHLPFFNLQTGSGGVALGIGFTGNWRATFTKVEEGVHVTIGQEATDFIMYPGETFRNLLMLTIFWKGDVSRSFNLLRNHLVRNYIPKDENGEPYPPICCMTWGGMKTHNHLKYIKYIKEAGLHFDIYWMDAGWHGPDHETDEFQDCNFNDWAYNRGEWRVNRCAHPQGLKPISDAAHDAGMKLLLWFGTYACNDGIGWHAEHPEWATESKGPYNIDPNPKMTTLHKINIHIPEAREWLANTIVRTIKENAVDGYREDCPAPSLPEEPGRIGLGDMQAVQNFYDFWDDLCEQIPGLFIDNCGGGGSRIDLETLKRSYVLWRTDYNCHPDADPIGAQAGNHGVGHFVPLVDCAPPTNPGSTYTFHSGLYGSMGFSLFHMVGFGEPEKHTWFADDYPVAWHKRMLDHYQLAKPYLSGSFYALTPCTLNRDDVLAYQFDRPDLQGGIILGFFRPECTKDSFEIKPVLEEGNYRFENVETGDCFEMEVKGGCKLTLRSTMKPESVYLHYKKI